MSKEDWQWLEDIQENLDAWVFNNKDRYPAEGPTGTNYYKQTSRFITCIKEMRAGLEFYASLESNEREPTRAAPIGTTAMEVLIKCSK